MALSPPPRTCDACASRYQPARVTSRYCSDRCRKRAQRAGLAQPRGPVEDVRPSPPRPAALQLGENEAAHLEELRAADRLDTRLGRQTLWLARRLDNALMDGGSAAAALSRELRATAAEALAAAQGAGDALDELARARQERLARARG